MVEQNSPDWWLRRHPTAMPLRLLLVGWRPAMRWESRDQALSRDPFLRIYWNRTSGAEIVCQGRRTDLGPDRLVAILPETPHRRRSTGASDHFFIHAAFDDPAWRLATGVRVLAVEPWLRRIIDALLTADPPRRWVERAATAIASAVICELPLAEQTPDPEIQLLADAIQPFARHPGSWPGSQALARRLGWAERTLSRRFHHLCGLSPREWIGTRRIETACDLLAHGQTTIPEIALHLGYGDRFHFTRAFTAARGLGPAAYRRQAEIA